MFKFLRPHIFQTTQWIWFIFGMMIDIGPEFYSAIAPTTPIYDLKVKVTDLELLCLKFYVKVSTVHMFQTI